MIRIEGIRKSYGEGEHSFPVLKDVSLEIDKGDFVVLLGASGSGKTTLLNVISGLERPDRGSVRYGEQEITGLKEAELTRFRREHIGFIFQQYYLLPNLTVDGNVKMGANLAGNKEYKETLAAVGLADKGQKYPHELSGGEQQRVSVARALAKKPEVLFLDEPTGALDEETGRLVLDYVSRLKQELGFTVVMVTHNANIADMARRVVRINSGRIVDIRRNETPKNAYEIGW